MVDPDIERVSERFTALFPALYHRFRRRMPVDAYRPSEESLALLRHLTRSGPLTVTEAGAHFSRSQAAMSEILTRLERRGLIERVADERDRRRTLVWLSPKGQAAAEDANRVLSTELVRHAVERMRPADRTQLLEGLEALLNTEPAEEGWDR